MTRRSRSGRSPIASVSRSRISAVQVAKEGIVFGPVGQVDQLFFPGVLAAFRMQGADFEALEFPQQLLIGGQIDVQLGSDFKVGRGAAELGHEGLNCLLDGTALATQFPWAPVEGAQIVQDRSADAKLRVTTELDLFGWIEFAEGVEQAYHTGAVEVFYGHMLRQSLMDAPGDKAHDGKMLDHELFLFGGEQIAGARGKRCSGCDGGSFFPCTVRNNMGDRADVLRRSSTPPRTPVTFSCFLHIHHPTCVRKLSRPWKFENP